MKKIFQNPFVKRINSFCAFCKTPRMIYRKKRIGLFDLLGAALGALVVMGFIFQEFDPSVFLFFVIFLAIAETFIQLRWRMGIVCQHCGFDPFLYVKKPDEAAAKVKIRLDQRREDPSMLLSTPLNLPYRIVKKESEKENSLLKKKKNSKSLLPRGSNSQKGSRVSRQV